LDYIIWKIISIIKTFGKKKLPDYKIWKLISFLEVNHKRLIDKLHNPEANYKKLLVYII